MLSQSRERKRNTELQPIDGWRHLRGLNPEQRKAVEYGIDGNAEPLPALLIAAGAGTGKTKALAHRVAHLILNGADPQRLLPLTFTRRAALETTRRAQLILTEARGDIAHGTSTPMSLLPWSGTFHAIGSRLLRLHAGSIGLGETFTILDRAHSANLLDLMRSEAGLSQTPSRFPRKDACLAIYSYTVNAGCPLEETLTGLFPWCAEWSAELRQLFQTYVAGKQRDNVLDYDDLLLYWRHAMAEPAVADIGRRFDHVLVDEYQDTNRLQAEILLALRPDGSGLTVVGDDAQSIYSFRPAAVRNILDFPGSVSPPAAVIALERNYRSAQPILMSPTRSSPGPERDLSLIHWPATRRPRPYLDGKHVNSTTRVTLAVACGGPERGASTCRSDGVLRARARLTEKECPACRFTAKTGGEEARGRFWKGEYDITPTARGDPEPRREAVKRVSWQTRP